MDKRQLKALAAFAEKSGKLAGIRVDFDRKMMMATDGRALVRVQGYSVSKALDGEGAVTIPRKAFEDAAKMMSKTQVAIVHKGYIEALNPMGAMMSFSGIDGDYPDMSRVFPNDFWTYNPAAAFKVLNPKYLANAVEVLQAFFFTGGSVYPYNARFLCRGDDSPKSPLYIFCEDEGIKVEIALMPMAV